MSECEEREAKEAGVPSGEAEASCSGRRETPPPPLTASQFGVEEAVWHAPEFHYKPAHSRPTTAGSSTGGSGQNSCVNPETGYHGVVRKSQSCYQAKIFHEGKLYHLGSFPSAATAARAYDNKCQEIRGEKAVVNFGSAWEAAVAAEGGRAVEAQRLKAALSRGQTKHCNHCAQPMLPRARICQECRRSTVAGGPYKGVRPMRKATKAPRWQAALYHNKRNHYLGTFLSPEEAAHAFDTFAREVFGEEAETNFASEAMGAAAAAGAQASRARRGGSQLRVIKRPKPLHRQQEQDQQQQQQQTGGVSPAPRPKRARRCHECKNCITPTLRRPCMLFGPTFTPKKDQKPRSSTRIPDLSTNINSLCSSYYSAESSRDSSLLSDVPSSTKCVKDTSSSRFAVQPDVEEKSSQPDADVHMDVMTIKQNLIESNSLKSTLSSFGSKHELGASILPSRTSGLDNIAHLREEGSEANDGSEGTSAVSLSLDPSHSSADETVSTDAVDDLTPAEPLAFDFIRWVVTAENSKGR